MITRVKQLLTHKVTACPSCSKQIRFPIKRGKVIQVTCPLCSHKFNIQFTSPLQILFKWNKQQRLKENIITIKNRFNALQPKDKQVMIFSILPYLLLLIFLFNIVIKNIFPSSETKQIQQNNAPKVEIEKTLI